MIESFTLQVNTSTLKITTQQQSWVVSYEYLRVYSPVQQHSKQPIIGHKKNVKLIAIEAVGKYGYRFNFDDKHSFIASDKILVALAENKEQNWQIYLKALTNQGLTREAQIEIINLS